MSTFLMPPRPEGTAQQQLQRQYAYLFQMAQQLNLALDSLEGAVGGVQSAVSAAADAKPAASGGRTGPTEEEKQQYNTLKSLIIRTADEIRAEMDKLTVELEGEYVAVSRFGTYLEQLNSSIQADPSAITQYYRFFSDLQADVETVDAAFHNYRVETEGYIRTGIVYYDGAVPVYGVAVGQDLAVQEIDGVTVVEQKNFRATYTASKLSFWQDATEVAYVSNNRLYINDITVLSGMTVGSWRISTDRGLVFQWIGG